MARKTMQQRFSDAFDRAEAPAMMRTQKPRMAIKRELKPRIADAMTEGLEEQVASGVNRIAKTVKRKN